MAKLRFRPMSVVNSVSMHNRILATFMSLSPPGRCPPPRNSVSFFETIDFQIQLVDSVLDVEAETISEGFDLLSAFPVGQQKFFLVSYMLYCLTDNASAICLMYTYNFIDQLLLAVKSKARPGYNLLTIPQYTEAETELLIDYNEYLFTLCAGTVSR
jgi:hypothetical protein